MGRRSESHLVVAAIPGGLKVSETVVDYSGAKVQLALLARLGKALGLRDNYALSINRDRNGSQIFVGLADSDDAAKLASAVQARGIGDYPGWVSQHIFDFDEQAAVTLAAELDQSHPKRRRRSLPTA
ncbi:hypothetical protein BH11PSE3_BH11PSE3_15430 [soil metagenome]